MLHYDRSLLNVYTFSLKTYVCLPQVNNQHTDKQVRPSLFLFLGNFFGYISCYPFDSLTSRFYLCYCYFFYIIVYSSIIILLIHISASERKVCSCFLRIRYRDKVCFVRMLWSTAPCLYFFSMLRLSQSGSGLYCSCIITLFLCPPMDPHIILDALLLLHTNTSAANDYGISTRRFTRQAGPPTQQQYVLEGPSHSDSNSLGDLLQIHVFGKRN